MSAEKLRKIKKQPKNTWFTLHKRLIGLPDPLETIFDPDVATFVDLKAKSLSTNRGYLASCIITTTAFIASTICTIESFGATFPINMYSIFMGPPTSGKSQAIKDCNTSPVENLAEEFNWGGVIISKCTSSALSKCLSSLKMGFMMSSEIFDVFHKLLKSDEDTASGDTQLLCQLFTGEKCTFRYATERTREIPANTPFSLLGATQVPYAAQLICQLDQGNGLLERLLLTAPSCLRPTVAVTQEATEELSNYRVATFTDIFIQMRRILTQTTFTFSDDATLTLQEINDDFIAQVNDAITNGRPTPTSKVFDLVQRVAVSLHIFNYIAVSMLHGNEVAPPREVQAQTLERAMKYVHWANEQKEVFVEVSFLHDLCYKLLLGSSFTHLSPNSLRTEAWPNSVNPISTGRFFTYFVLGRAFFAPPLFLRNH